jgi:hypothetical protein
MKIEVNNPKQISIIVILISFIFFTVVLSIKPPIWIIQINKKTGSQTIYLPLLLLYSSLFAIILGIIAFIITNKKTTEVVKSAFSYAK